MNTKLAAAVGVGVLLGLALGRIGNDMPVEFVICNREGADCEVKARFADRRGCEFHNKFMSALCTDNDTDLSAVCKFGRPSLISSSRCQ